MALVLMQMCALECEIRASREGDQTKKFYIQADSFLNDTV